MYFWGWGWCGGVWVCCKDQWLILLAGPSPPPPPFFDVYKTGPAFLIFSRRHTYIFQTIYVFFSFSFRSGRWSSFSFGEAAAVCAATFPLVSAFDAHSLGASCLTASLTLLQVVGPLVYMYIAIKLSQNLKITLFSPSPFVP